MGEVKKKEPFSQKDLNDIFKRSPISSDRIISRECSWLEFKESFGQKSFPKYLKTCAAFANVKGGYIVFGVGNKPHNLIGLIGKALDFFEDMDPQKLTEMLNNHFSPEIHWEIQEYELNHKIFGLLYVYESQSKPVICTKDSGNTIKEGDIYYRYRGRSERIKYSELRELLDKSRQNEQRLWMQHIMKISKIGVRDAGIFDLQTGTVSGTKGSFIIDESLLSQLSFIKEGEFSEIRGKPALKLIGDVEPISKIAIPSNKKIIVKKKGLQFSDIILDFLELNQVHEPKDYITQICFGNTAFLPVYFYIDASELNKDQAITLVDGVISRSPSKAKLLERLKSRFNQSLVVPASDSYSAIAKRKYLGQIIDKKSELQSLDGKELEYCLQAIRCFKRDALKHNSGYIRGILKFWFNKHYSNANQTLADHLRRAICWVDEALFKEGVS